MKTFANQTLWRHKEKLVDGNVRPALDGMRNRGRIMLSVRRPVGRTFYGAGKRLPFHPDDFYPFGESVASVPRKMRSWRWAFPKNGT